MSIRFAVSTAIIASAAFASGSAIAHGTPPAMPLIAAAAGTVVVQIVETCPAEPLSPQAAANLPKAVGLDYRPMMPFIAY
ncbi:MAG: hypothetical protein AAFR11_11815 [Pseudomonadota bacterium]